MNKTLIVFVLCLVSMSSFAQAHTNDNLWYNNGAQVYIGSNCLVTVQGDITNNQAGVTGTTHITNNGFLWALGNMYSDNAFKQAGTGTVRLQNKTALYTAPYASENYQTIQGGYRVNGGQPAIGASDDGSFYNLELDNQNGMIFIKDNTDVVNSVDFKPASISIDGATIAPNGTANRILTYDPGTAASAAAAPANGEVYTTVFGMMNNAAGLANFKNLSTNLTTNTTTMDNAYIQGKLRRAVNTAAGGSYGFPLGLQPSSSNTAARGIQYAKLDFTASSYDVVTGYFQQGSDNTVANPGSVCTLSGGFVYYGASNHGQWVFASQTAATQAYNLTIYPQDYGTTNSLKYFITKSNAVPNPGTQACAASPNGLSVSGVTGMGSFDFAGGSQLLPVTLKSFTYTTSQCEATLNWKTDAEMNTSYFEVQQSIDGINWATGSTVMAAGNSTIEKIYSRQVTLQPVVSNFFRIEMVDLDGRFTYSPVITISCNGKQNITVYPNPVTSSLNIQGLPEGAKEMAIYNAAGETIVSNKISNRSFGVSFAAFPPGVYFVRILSASGNVVLEKKIIK